MYSSPPGSLQQGLLSGTLATLSVIFMCRIICDLRMYLDREPELPSTCRATGWETRGGRTNPISAIDFAVIGELPSRNDASD